MALHSPYLWKKGQCSKPVMDVMGITHHGRSEAVNRALSDFGIEESFGQAATRFCEHYHYSLSSSTADRVTKEVASDAQVYVKEKLAQASDECAIQGQDSTRVMVETMLIELDGCDIRTAELQPIEGTKETSPIRELPKKRKNIGWKEVRLGFARPLESREKVYIGKMASYPEVVGDLFDAATLMGMTSATQVVGIADGGNGLKEELERQFESLQFILDKTHLKDHLYETAEALGIERQERPGWVKTRLEATSLGEVTRLINEFEEVYRTTRTHRVKQLLGYLQRFAHAVNYQDFKARGYPIGSGEIESAHKSVPQQRLKLPGACWHSDSINPMLALRIVRANEWWDNFWEDRIKRKMAA